MSVKFGNTKGTKDLLKLARFGVATLTVSSEATESRPAGDALASSECIFVSSFTLFSLNK